MKTFNLPVFQLFDLPYSHLLWTPHKDEPHKHNYFEIYYLLHGEVKNFLNGKKMTLMEGDLYIVAHKDVHCCLENTSSEIFQRNFLIADDEFKKMCDTFSPLLYDSVLSKSPIKLQLSSQEICDLESEFAHIDISHPNNLDTILTIYRFILSKILKIEYIVVDIF